MTPAKAPKAQPDHARRQRGMFDDLKRAFEAPTWFHLTPLPPRLGVVRLPSTDVLQKDNEIIVTAELPGVNKDDVHVELRDPSLTIQAEARSQHEAKNHDRVERTYGRLYRRIPLGFDVDQDQVKASLTDGVLEVRIPQPAEYRQSSRIPIS